MLDIGEVQSHIFYYNQLVTHNSRLSGYKISLFSICTYFKILRESLYSYFKNPAIYKILSYRNRTQRAQ